MIRHLVLLSFLIHLSFGADRPNVLWVTSEDNGPQLGCYGDDYAKTPHLDALAAQGMRYTRAWSVAPVCAPARTAIITGRYPSAIGALHMRSMVPLKAGGRLFPQDLRAAGVYCSNRDKQDYNVPTPSDTWDESSKTAHWRNRAPGQPFFAVFNFGQSHEGQIRKRPHTAIHDPALAPLAPYWPDLPEVRQDWAQYYDCMTEIDHSVHGMLKDLQTDQLADDTIVFYFGDHGPGMPRGKRAARNGGLHVPLIVYFPEKWKHLAPPEYKAGGVSDRLVSFVDFAPTLRTIFGLPPSLGLSGKSLQSPQDEGKPQYIFGERGRMDERYDCVRTVTDGRYVYVENFFTHRPDGQKVTYSFETPTARVWHRAFLEGKLSPAQAAYWQPHPPVELYDLTTDPHEINNLAGVAAHSAAQARLEQALADHLVKQGDRSLGPEAEMQRRIDAADWPTAEIHAAARRAAGIGATPHEVVDDLKSTEPIIRWWAVLGHIMRQRAAPVDLLDDVNASVRIAAAESLAKFGDAAQKVLATEKLIAAADANVVNYHDALWAWNALDDLAPTLTTTQRAVLLSYPVAPAERVARAGGYLNLMRNHFKSHANK